VQASRGFESLPLRHAAQYPSSHIAMTPEPFGRAPATLKDSSWLRRNGCLTAQCNIRVTARSMRFLCVVLALSLAPEAEA
jgi:hypothetical protein